MGILYEITDFLDKKENCKMNSEGTDKTHDQNDLMWQ
jgi:hypothetical protein